jgi:hypothetical protein
LAELYKESREDVEAKFTELKGVAAAIEVRALSETDVFYGRILMHEAPMLPICDGGCHVELGN